jgi:hypothetical protein
MYAEQFTASVLSGLFGALVGAGAGIYGARRAVMYTEYLRRAELLKLQFRSLIHNITKGIIPCATNIVGDDKIDNAIADIIPYMFPIKRCRFTKAWEKYRYNKEGNDTPDEYLANGDTGPNSIKKVNNLIQERLSHLISLLK